VQHQLHRRNQGYKKRVDIKGKVNKFEERYLVLTHLRKEIFLKGTHNKMEMKKIAWSCKILKKISTNAYVIELFECLYISPTFNIVYLYDFHEGMVDDMSISLIGKSRSKA
jgi:hypothetical protein